jgi:dynein intermediate chain 1
MCLSFHPQEPSLLAVGLYDGTVLVYDIKCKLPNNRPIYQSNVRTKKHTDPVWQVSWLDAPLSKQQLCFYSISSDGRITSWTLQKNKLDAEDIIKLKMVPKEVTKESSEAKSETQASDAAAEVDEDATYYGYAGGMCFDFNKFNPSLFLVGTEEGNIHLCSKTYSGQYMETYEGHVLAVYAVRWNPFHESVFLSCSADWTIKMWEQSSKSPVCIFDLQSAINDIEWAPYSSTSMFLISFRCCDSQCFSSHL